MNYKFLLIFIGILLNSCETKSQVKIQTEDWYGKKIILPTENLMRYKTPKHSIPLSKKIKIITSINGGCPACIDELKDWKSYMKIIDTSQVGFIYLIYSDDDLFTFKELNNQYIKLSYPYFHDIKKSITSVNNISENKLFSTFLLNEKNEVILAGNPNKNKEIYERYSEEINKRVAKVKPIVKIEQSVSNGTKFKISKGFIYKDDNGDILSKTEQIKMLSDQNFVPVIDTDKNIITFKKK